MKTPFFLFFLLFSLTSQSQDHTHYGTPVKEIQAIRRIESLPEKAVVKTVLSQRNTPTHSFKDTSKEVGITEGELSVSLTGGANYSIPIQVPPGIKGVVPSVSLSYNSQGENGMAGYGWNITGFSVIRRINPTLLHDGILTSICFSDTDRFALDGQRLLLKSGTYGKDGAEYQTENFSNVKITSHGISNYGPAYFMVYYPDGSVARYGGERHSSPTDYGIVYSENSQGIRINYQYTLANNILNIKSITYGGQSTATSINEIQFVYKERKRPEQAYINGISFLKNTLLSEIKVISNGIGFRNYTLTHQKVVLGYERLISCTESSGENDKSYNPIWFHYEDTPYKALYDGNGISLVTGNISQLNTAVIAGDFSGNNEMGFIIYPTTGNDTKSKYWVYTGLEAGINIGWEHNSGKFKAIFPVNWLNHDFKLMPYQGWTIVKEGTDTDIVDFTTYCNSSISIYEQSKKQYVFPKFIYNTAHPLSCRQPSRPPIQKEISVSKQYISGDFNGDGLTDIVAIESGLQYSITYCDPDNNSVTETQIRKGAAYFVNLDRRLTTDYVTNIGSMDILATSKLVVADVNGDGKADILVFDTGSVKAYTLNPTNTQLELLWITTSHKILFDEPLLLGDFNGDGKTDFIIPNRNKQGTNNSYTEFLSTGKEFAITHKYFGFEYKTSKVGAVHTYIYNYITTDINNDGKTDIIRTAAHTVTNANPLIGEMRIELMVNREGLDYYGNRCTFFPDGETSSIEGSLSYINNDDMVRYPLPVALGATQSNPLQQFGFISHNKLFQFSFQKDFGKDKLLKKIIQGTGVTETITYTPLIQEPYEQYYVPSSYTAIFPNMDIESAPNLKVVTSIEKKSGTLTKQQDFKYYGAVSNLEGLGFMGFRSLLKTNWYNANHAKIYQISRHSPEMRGAVTESFSTQTKNWDFWDSTDNYIDKTKFAYHYEVLPNKVFKIKNTVNEQLNGLNTTNSITITEYDNYNNPIQATTLLKEGTTLQQTTIAEVRYSNQPNGTHYHIGRPLSKKQSVTAYKETRTGEEQYTYTPEGLLTEVKKKGHQTDCITENNVYDVFGNITKKTISANGITPRISTFEYDVTGRFLVKSTDTEGLESQFEYNPVTGLVVKETSPFGQTTSYQYDVWGKKTQITDYLGKKVSFIYTKEASNYTITKKAEDGSESFSVYNPLGRILKTGVKNREGQWSYKAYEYDLYGKVIRESDPYFDTPLLWSTAQYDLYGRLTETKAITGKTTKRTYKEQTTTINDGIQTVTTVKDAMGNILSVTDSGGTIQYTYSANGNQKTATYEGSVIKTEQDGWGRKTKLIDPSAGTYQYIYNSLGELTKEKTPKGTTTYLLDQNGKLTRKTIQGDSTDMVTDYNYDPDTGLLTRLQSTVNGEAMTYTYQYDNYMRLYATTEETPFAKYKRTNQYDTFGRIQQEAYEAHNKRDSKSITKSIQNTYKNGYHWQIIDADTQKILWQPDKENARGQLEQATLGNGTISANTYDTYGYLTRIGQSTPANTLMELTTVFDIEKGNLISRTNSVLNRTENFEYDQLSRLIKYTNANGEPEQQSYDVQGRITQNSIGSYTYSIKNKPYQASGIKDLNEAETNYYISRALQTIVYNSFKAPVSIHEQTQDRIDFMYNPFGQRSSRRYGGLQKDPLQRPFHKQYSNDGSIEIKEDTTANTTEFVLYIGGDGYSAPIILKSDGTTEAYYYLHRDYLGSIIAITDAEGTITEQRHFDAWGQLVQCIDAQGKELNKLTFLDRGYTGHEHLQSVGLIHMNGRLYDAKVHRFLQPDNFVQDSFNTQNLNRYGYGLNNPLSYIDPSGESLFGVIIVGAVIGAVTGGGAYLAHAVKTGDWNWGQFGISVLSGAVIGGTSAGISPTVSATAVTVSALSGSAGSAFVAGLIPSATIPLGDWSVTLSPAIAFGNASGVGANISAGYSDRNWSFSAGMGLMEYSDYNGFGKNGMEIRKSILVSWDDGKTGVSLGTNIWSGGFDQRTGVIGFHSGDFNLMYENDGGAGIKHLGLGDKGDGYRTAALNLSIGNYSAGFNLFTGKRTDIPRGKSPENRLVDNYGRKYTYGYAKEVVTKYRLGALTVGYKEYRTGVNSEHVRHAIQDRVIHGLIHDQGFENQSWNWNSYFQYRTSNKFTSW